MSQLLWKALIATTAILGTSLIGVPSSQALPDSGELPSDPMDQLTSVSELRDVAPTEWAYEALQSLVERYGCIVGYPDSTYRGNRALTRWEFAAGLNACMNTIERLIQENVAVLKEDVDTLKRLAQEFETELAALGGRVDNLEARVSFLEDHQFSTTTKLTGEAVMAVYGIIDGDRDGGEDTEKVPAFGHRTRLELNTSFTGEDLLFTRLATGNIADLSEEAGTFEGSLEFSQPDDNDVAVEVLNYSFPIAEGINIWIEGTGGAFDDFTSTNNFLDGDGGTGALSAFGTRNPIYSQGEGAGLGIQGALGAFEFSLGYLATEANDPSEGAGLFNGPYGAIAQAGFVPNEEIAVAATFVYGYNNLDTGTGSRLSNFQSFTEEEFGEAVNTENYSAGLGFSWRVADFIVLGGWGGYTHSEIREGGPIGDGSLEIWNWAATLAFPDLFKEGSTGGIIVGMQPWVSDSDININIAGVEREEDRDTSLHIEAFYEYALTDNIKITPGVIVITAPDSNDDNSPLVIGTIRTTFTF
jgi:Carbohydrate-selective porin, OprB family/S-layer homology domain